MLSRIGRFMVVVCILNFTFFFASSQSANGTKLLIETKATNIFTGIYEVTFLKPDLTSDMFYLDWRLFRNGDIFHKGQLDELPSSSAPILEIQIPYKKFNNRDGSVYTLDVSYRLKQDEKYGLKDKEISWQQIVLSEKRTATYNRSNPKERISILGRKEKYNFTSDNFFIVLERDKGFFEMFHLRDTSRILSGPFIKPVAQLDESVDPSNDSNQWKSTGMDRLDFQTDDFQIAISNAGYIFTIQQSAYLPSGRVIAHIKYIVGKGPTVDVEVAIETEGDLPDISHPGVYFEVDEKMNHLSWFGLGPYDFYTERKLSTRLGKYHSTVASQVKSDKPAAEKSKQNEVSYVTLSDEFKTSTLIVQGSDQFHSHVQHHTSEIPSVDSKQNNENTEHIFLHIVKPQDDNPYVMKGKANTLTFQLMLE